MRYIAIMMLAAGLVSDCARSQATQNETVPGWEAGMRVNAAVIEAWGGEDACFNAQPIDSTMAARMVAGGSYPDCGALISLDELSCLHVLHVNMYRDTLCGEMVCNKAIASLLLDIFAELYHNSYPVERMVTIDEYGADDEASMRANNTSCFCYRAIAGSAKLSNHARGMAVDLNPLYNPYIKTSDGKTVLQPATAGAYIDRKADFPFKIDENDLAYKLFTSHGFTWGGSWTSLKDYQHFEK